MLGYKLIKKTEVNRLWNKIEDYRKELSNKDEVEIELRTVLAELKEVNRNQHNENCVLKMENLKLKGKAQVDKECKPKRTRKSSTRNRHTTYAQKVEIYEKYYNGVSMNKLKDEYNIGLSTVSLYVKQIREDKHAKQMERVHRSETGTSKKEK